MQGALNQKLQSGGRRGIVRGSARGAGAGGGAVFVCGRSWRKRVLHGAGRGGGLALDVIEWGTGMVGVWAYEQ